jgi:hypothetical protein
MFSAVICWAQISRAQDNKEYLLQLDRNISGTIEVMTTFNETLINLPDHIKGKTAFSVFLMEMTMECGGIKKDISLSWDFSAVDREEMIRNLIANLNPEVPWFPYYINNDKDRQNRELTVILKKRLIEHVLAVQKEIMRQEAGILESGSFHKYFFHLHSEHFMYQLLLDFIEPADYLSADNRDYLIKMVRHIEDSLIKAKSEIGREE